MAKKPFTADFGIRDATVISRTGSKVKLRVNVQLEAKGNVLGTLGDQIDVDVDDSLWDQIEQQVFDAWKI